MTRKANSGQLIKYLFDKEEKLSNKQLSPLIIRHNIRSRSVNGYIKEFAQNESLRIIKRKDSCLLNHTVLSFHKKDNENISEKVLKDIAKKYIELRGRDSLYLGALHADKDHLHLHLVASGTKYLTGKSNRISKTEFHQLKTKIQEYQKEKYPELKFSLPEHGKSKSQKLNIHTMKNKKTTERLSMKTSLIQFLETTFAKSESSQDFFDKVYEQGHTPYFRNGKIQGVKFNDETKFRIKSLGFDAERLKLFDIQKQADLRELEELQSLREPQRQEPEKEIKPLPELPHDPDYDEPDYPESEMVGQVINEDPPMSREEIESQLDEFYELRAQMEDKERDEGLDLSGGLCECMNP